MLDYDNLHGELREKIKVLHPTSNGNITPKTTGTDSKVLDDILNELKKINKKLDN